MREEYIAQLEPFSELAARKNCGHVCTWSDCAATRPVTRW
jgi:hypothetical protein